VSEKSGILHLLGVDRLLYFTDALVAIAATLLVLPLVEAAGTYVGACHVHDEQACTGAGSAWEFLSDQHLAIVAFVISFLVIVRLWTAHHHLFSVVTAADTTLIWLDLAWAFTIVLLPLPTELTQLEDPSDPHQPPSLDHGASAVAFYVGTMLVSSLLLMLVVLHVRRHAELREPDRMPLLAPSVATSLLFALALVVGVLVGGYLPLLALLASGLLAKLISPRLDAKPSGA
jgi:uncharacterized membrane protein